MLLSIKRHLRKILYKKENPLFSLHYMSKKGEFEKSLNIRKGEWFFISLHGIGDLCMILSLLPEFKRIHNARKIGIGITNKKHRDIFSLFPESADRVEFIQENDLILCKSNRFEPGNPIVIHPEHIYPSSMQSLIGYKNITLIDIYKILLNLPIDCKMAGPVNPGREAMEKATRRFEEYGLTYRRTILLAPDAFSYSIPVSSQVFWSKLVGDLQENGYKTAMMSANPELQYISGIINVAFPLNEALAFVNLCGGFIGNRSGFCDLIAGSPVTKVILYSTEIWHSGKLINSCSLIRMGTAGDKTFELEPDHENLGRIIPEIINLIRQNLNE